MKKNQRRNRRNYNKKKRIRTRRRNICIGIILFCILVAFGATKLPAENKSLVKNNKNNTEEATTKNNTDEKVTYKIEAPKKRKKSEIYAQLKKWSKKDSKMATLYKNKDNYPKSILKAVVNNPEMIDFANGYLTAEKVRTGKITEKEKTMDFPLLIQWDKRWAYISYGDSNIGMAGCGPTCLSMVIMALTRDYSITPDVIAKFSDEYGYYVEGQGTSWSLMSDAVNPYGIMVSQLTLEEDRLKVNLDEGSIAICSVGPGDFTTAGHFIVIYGYEGDDFLINDPYCKSRSKKKWKFDNLKSQIRSMWIYNK